MKKFFCVLTVFIPLLNLFAQSAALEYTLTRRHLSKTSAPTPAGNAIDKILIQNNIIWLATGTGLSKSTDNGATWTNYYNTPDFGTESVSAIGYSNGTIWAATWHYENEIDNTLPVGTGLHYSTDDGNTWTTIAQPIDQQSDTVIIYGSNKIKALPVVNNSQNYVRQFAFTKNTVWIATAGGGLRKSTDMGKTWDRVVVPPDNRDSIKPSDILNFSLGVPFGPFGNLNHIGYSVLAVNDSTLYYGSYGGGINKSTDGGVSWVKFTHDSGKRPISGNQIMDLAFNKFDNSIWAATWKSFGTTEYWGISFTKDGGQTWETNLPDSRTLDFGFKYSGNPDNITDVDIFAATLDGVYRSSDGGTTWIIAPRIEDDVTGISINTQSFFCVKANARTNGTTDIWIGSSEGLARLNEKANDFWLGTWKVYLASEHLSSASETYAFPNPFSPAQGLTKIKYSTSQAANVTIRIMDFGMNLVRTLIQNAPRNTTGEHFENWNGQNESGRIVPNGVYFYRIDLGSEKPLFGKIMVVR